MRSDLLHLTDDDLATFANRGIVKRARAESDDATLTFDIKVDADGKLTVGWSDDATCTFPADATLHQAVCTCPATSVCRHIVRSVFAYQKVQSASKSKGEPPAPPGPWNPGEFTDAHLAAVFSQRDLERAKKNFETGCVAEVRVGVRPSVYFHDLSLSLRFLVREDPRYVHCDCAETSPCRHVPLAVFAFRALSEGKTSEVIAIEPSAPPPVELLDELDAALAGLFETGFANLGKSQEGALRRLAARCRAAGLAWPADALHDLFLEFDRYAGHDARFDATEVAELVAELRVRSDALRTHTKAIPRQFIQGDASEKPTDIGTARMVGLGCGVKPRRNGVVVTAYFQDADSGAVTAIRRDFPDPTEAGATPRTFVELARTSAMKGATFAALGGGQAVVKGGKRLPDGSFVVGRAQAAASPQNFAWENLRAPLFSESFEELTEHLKNRPPAMLGPRRLAERLAVCPVVKVEWARFDGARQEVQALVRDEAGDGALLVHPFFLRGRDGAERLLAELTHYPDSVKFVSGEAVLRNGMVEIAPLAIVFQGERAKYCVQPWVDGPGEAVVSNPNQPLEMTPTPDPAGAFRLKLSESLRELLHSGLTGADDRLREDWRSLAQNAAVLGLSRLGPPIRFIADTLESGSLRLAPDPDRTARATATAVALNGIIHL